MTFGILGNLRGSAKWWLILQTSGLFLAITGLSIMRGNSTHRISRFSEIHNECLATVAEPETVACLAQSELTSSRRDWSFFRHRLSFDGIYFLWRASLMILYRV